MQAEVSTVEALVTKIRLEEFWNELEKVQALIEKKMPKEEEDVVALFQECKSEHAIFERNYYKTATKLQVIIEKATLKGKQPRKNRLAAYNSEARRK